MMVKLFLNTSNFYLEDIRGNQHCINVAKVLKVSPKLQTNITIYMKKSHVFKKREIWKVA